MDPRFAAFIGQTEAEAAHTNGAERAWTQADFGAEEANGACFLPPGTLPVATNTSPNPTSPTSPPISQSRTPTAAPHGHLEFLLSSSRPIVIATPPGTTAIYMSVMSRDTQFSSSKLSWVIDNKTYGIDFTRPQGADDVLIDKDFGLPIGAITEEMPDEVELLCSVAVLETAWRVERRSGPVILGPVAEPVGPNGNSFKVQIKFRGWMSDCYSPEFTTVTIVFQGVADGHVEQWRRKEPEQILNHHFFTRDGPPVM